MNNVIEIRMFSDFDIVVSDGFFESPSNDVNLTLLNKDFIQDLMKNLNGKVKFISDDECSVLYNQYGTLKKGKIKISENGFRLSYDINNIINSSDYQSFLSKKGFKKIKTESIYLGD